VAVAASDVITDEVRSLSYWLEEVPKTLFGGFDRKATRQLVAKLDASYRDVVVQREKLLTELEKMQAFSAEFERRERELVAEAERLAGELATSQEEQGSLRRQLECARTRWDAELARAKADLERELEQARIELADYRRRELLSRMSHALPGREPRPSRERRAMRPSECCVGRDGASLRSPVTLSASSNASKPSDSGS
jgi:hypothetical protein